MSLIEQGKVLGIKWLRRLRDRKAISPMAVAVTIVSAVLGIYMFALMFPDAIYMLFNATWHADVPSGVQTLATTVVAIIGVVVFILIMLKQAE